MLSAQAWCGDREDWGCSQYSGDHFFSNLGHGNTDGAHTDCRWAADETHFEHTECVPTDNAPDLMAYRQAADALANGDYLTAVELGERLDGLLFFNRRRGAIQLRDCRGEALVASFPVPQELIQRVELAATDLKATT